ncbi:MAG: hypothetical protein J6S67_01090 [Methanobrevibacter sp.]|nr:hypothetical protein [Methanobrevibacter sp.]
MTIRETIKALTSEGHTVSYYIRKDGGVLIKSIDGRRFTGASGNIYARTLTGQTLSEKRSAQLERITYTGKRAKAYIQDREVKKMLQRVQRKWRKAFPRENGEVPAVGRKTAKGVRWSLEHRGKEETIRLLSEAERYASGKAYSKNIEQLAMHIEDYASKTGSEELLQLAQDIRDNAWMIREDSIKPAYEELYKLNDGVPPEEVARNTRRILQIP